MTGCFPPLIKPDRRFSRIRLSEFHVSLSVGANQFGGQGMESIFCEEVAIRPALVFSHGIAVPFGGLRALSLSKRFAPEPLAKSPDDEVVHLREAPVMVFPSKVIAPATARFVDLSDDLAGRFPGGVAPRQFAHPVPERGNGVGRIMLRDSRNSKLRRSKVAGRMEFD